jgi:hypothetical protein
MRSDDSIQISLTFLYAAALLGPPLPGPVTYLRSGLARTSAARPLLTYTPAMTVSRLAETVSESKKFGMPKTIVEDIGKKMGQPLFVFLFL